MQPQVIILGAGGAGLMCAAHAARRGRSVLVLDHAAKAGGKIPISGGGKCNFTNLGAGPANYVSRNPHFCRSALSRYTHEDFLELVRAHGIPYEERKHGQLFGLVPARALVEMLETESREAGAQLLLGTQIERVARAPAPAAGGARFEVASSAGSWRCEAVVVATGGLSLPKTGATGLGYELARQFGLEVTPLAPALDGFVFSREDALAFRDLSGISIEGKMTCGGLSFREAILFTHAGLSGPASLQASLHWQPGAVLEIDTLPGRDAFAWFLEQKRQGRRALVRSLLAELLPARFAERLCDRFLPESERELPLPQVSERKLEEFCANLHAWRIVPAHTVGYGKAEVTRGGVATEALSSKTMEARTVPGLFFIGEVVDVTGWLGGYNYQWAWASGWAAGQVV